MYEQPDQHERFKVGRDPDVAVTAVADEVMRYLRAHGAAGDTAYGIWRWWLTDQREKVDVMIVEQALERLVAEGRIGRRMLVSGEAFYFGSPLSARSGA